MLVLSQMVLLHTGGLAAQHLFADLLAFRALSQHPLLSEEACASVTSLCPGLLLTVRAQGLCHYQQLCPVVWCLRQLQRQHNVPLHRFLSIRYMVFCLTLRLIFVSLR
jgi:hypothetical protein